MSASNEEKARIERMVASESTARSLSPNKVKSLDPAVHAFLLEERQKLIQQSVSNNRANSGNASQKGEVWREGAKAAWREKHAEFKGLPKFCEYIMRTDKPLIATDGRAERPPSYRRLYNFLRDARKAGEL